MKTENKSLKRFKTKLRKNICPFCNTELQHYDGALGYEAMKCNDCKLAIDYNGIQLE